MPAPLTGVFTSGGGATAPRAYASNEHPLGSAAQHNLTDSQYEAHYRLAVALLSIDKHSWPDSQMGLLQTAVSLQVNYQLAHNVVSLIVQSESRGGRSVSYRERVPLIDPHAALLVRQLLGASAFRTVTTARPLVSGGGMRPRVRAGVSGDVMPVDGFLYAPDGSLLVTLDGSPLVLPAGWPQ